MVLLTKGDNTKFNKTLTVQAAFSLVGSAIHLCNLIILVHLELGIPKWKQVLKPLFWNSLTKILLSYFMSSKLYNSIPAYLNFLESRSCGIEVSESWWCLSLESQSWCLLPPCLGICHWMWGKLGEGERGREVTMGSNRILKLQF